MAVVIAAPGHRAFLETEENWAAKGDADMAENLQMVADSWRYDWEDTGC